MKTNTNSSIIYDRIHDLKSGYGKIHLIIKENNEDFVTIHIENLNYYQNRNKKIKWLIFFLLIIIIYYVFMLHLILIDIFLILCCCTVIYQIINLIKFGMFRALSMNSMNVKISVIIFQTQSI